MKPKMDIISFMNCKLESLDGSKVKASDLWRDQDAIFVFARDLECAKSRAHIGRIFENRESLTDAGAQIYLIVTDKSTLSEAVRAELGIGDTPVYEDNSFVSFRAAGFNKGFVVLAEQSLKTITRVTPEHCAEKYQIGGIVLIKKCGAVPFHSILNAAFDRDQSQVAIA